MIYFMPIIVNITKIILPHRKELFCVSSVHVFSWIDAGLLTLAVYLML